MRLRTLLEGLDVIRVSGSTEVLIRSVEVDSRNVTKGALFVCLAGFQTDGHVYAARAAEQGAAALVVEKTPELTDGATVTVVWVKDSRKALALISAKWFDFPSGKLTVIGITGTKGKTTTAHMLRRILEENGFRTGMIGTLGAHIGDVHIETCNTTPESYEIHSLLHRMSTEGCTHVVMEVSSQGLKLDRTFGLRFDIGIFLNISPDHVGPGEHSDFGEYLQCKRRLFGQVSRAVVNLDDTHWKDIAGEARELYGFSVEKADGKGESEAQGAMEGPVSRENPQIPERGEPREKKKVPGDMPDPGRPVSLSGEAVFLEAAQVERLWEPGLLGSSFAVHGAYEGKIRLNMPGIFNVENALAALGAARLLGVAFEPAARALEQVGVKGRTQLIKSVSHFSTFLIDYAHNALSMESLLTMLKDYRPGRLICLFGGGGNKPRARRYDMGLMAGKYADLTILTTDNPRWESVEEINRDIIEGLRVYGGLYRVIPDREKAIRYLLDNSGPGDIVALIGKGHEEYQEIGGTKYYFSEEKIIEAHLETK